VRHGVFGFHPAAVDPATERDRPAGLYACEFERPPQWWLVAANSGPAYELTPLDVASTGGLWIVAALDGETVAIAGARGAAGGLPAKIDWRLAR
jgi:hypothetical protein